ncbi:MAG: hypothetical protein SF052_12670 [Bacteroidia bacterium]|nr:hypothetical protein [Bacteroidia bacterium]
MRLIYSFIFLSFFLVDTSDIYAQNIAEKDTTQSKLFVEETPLRIRLAFDQKKFLSEKYKDEYQPAAITLFSENGDSLSGTIRIKARGEFRRRFCQFPPFRLNFKDSGFSDPSFEGVSSLKLVTVCKFPQLYQEYIFREYTLYKLYNVLSPMSFRARLVDMTFEDNQGKRKPLERFGFLIEDVDHLAKRNDAFELEPKIVNSQMMNRKQLLMISMFQYMIGNCDWYVPNLHNLKLLKSNDFRQEMPYPVPYDFDYAGMVNAVYAIPPEGLGITNVTERIYRGPCFNETEAKEMFALFHEKKDEIIRLYEESPWLDEFSKTTSVSYLNEFYKIIENPGSVKTKILSTCK